MKAPSERATVKRHAERGVYDEETIYEILDEALICHVALSTDSGPIAIPTIHARVGDKLYLHGSPASRLLRSALGSQICVTATIVDGIVAARSTFHHSLNYRSVMVLGTPRAVVDPQEREIAFEAIVNHVIPGRWDEARRPNTKEDKGTKLLVIDITEASAKVRSGPPIDADEDLNTGIWAGVIPLVMKAGVPEPAPDLERDLELPDSIRNFGR